jgi:hypothetical protein
MLDSEFSDEDHLHSNHIESEEDLLQDEDGGEGGDQFDQRGEEEESKGREEKRARNSKRKDPPIDTTSLEALKRRIVHLETELEKKDDLVEQLTNALETSQEEKEAKDSELAQVTQTLLPLAESLHKMQEQLDERDAHQERERESVEAQFADLVQQLEAAREAIQKKEREIEVLQHENQHLKEQIVIKKGSTSPPSTSEEENGDENDGNVDRQSDVDISDNRLRQARMEGVDEEVTETEEEYEETMGEAAGPPVRHQGKAEESVVEEEKKSDPIDNFKEEMEREYKKINESLQSAEQFSLMFSKRTRELTSNIYRIREVRELEKEKGKIEESLANDDESSADDGFEQKIKSWPREMVEKQLKHYRVICFNSSVADSCDFFCGVSQEGELTLWCAAGRLQLGAKESGGDGGGEEQGGGGAHVGQARARTETTGSGDATKRQGAARAIRGPACRGIASARSFTSSPSRVEHVEFMTSCGSSSISSQTNNRKWRTRRRRWFP